MHKIYTQSILVIASVFSSHAMANGGFPSDQAIDAARAKNREVMESITLPKTGQQSLGQYNFSALPKAVTAPKPLDPQEMAKQYQSLGKMGMNLPKAKVLIFVSSSMPRGSLERVLDQAELAGASVLFRGFNGQTITQMQAYVADLVGKRLVDVLIDPPSFKKFSVAHVPTVVLSKPSQSELLDDEGCSPPESFVKVSGDVSLDYALEHIERHRPEWRTLTGLFLTKLRNTP